MKDLIESFRNARAHPRLAVLRIANPVKDAETITIGTTVFEASTDGVVASPRILVDLRTAASLLAAAITGTFSGVGTANDTITINAQVYKLVAAVSAANDVLIGASAGATRDNLVAAINAAAGAGTTYGTGTVANTAVSAVAASTADITLTARTKGTVGNSIAISEAGTGFSFAGGATVLANGADTSAADFTTLFTAVINTVPLINTQTGVGATRIGANEVLIFETKPSASPLATTETMLGTNNEFLSTTMYGGEGAPLTIPNQCMFTRVPTANEVAVGNIHIKLAFVPNAWLIGVNTTSTGARRSWDGTVVKNGNRLTLAAGTTPLAATETITIMASE